MIATRSDGHAGGRRRSTPAVPCPTTPGCRSPLPANVTLGFAFAKSADAAGLRERLPPALARHAAVALALVTESMSTERELAALRAREVERSSYVSTVAHELRTPLTGLSGYLDLILDGHVDDEAIQREFLERGRSIAGSMTALIGDLLELSRLESGSLLLDVEPFSVADMLHTVGATFLPIALDRDVPLITTPPTRIRTATGDRRRVEQIVTNLAANALKFGAAGAEVELTGRFDGPAAMVAVRDEGPGIGADDRARIFDRFYRMADHERVTGTGLGLSISRDLARSHGWRSRRGQPALAPARRSSWSCPARGRRWIRRDRRRRRQAAVERGGRSTRRPRPRSARPGARAPDRPTICDVRCRGERPGRPPLRGVSPRLIHQTWRRRGLRG